MAIARLVIVSGLLTLATCTVSVTTDHDKDVDFSRFQTWAWAPEVRVLPTDPRLANRNADEAVRDSIELELAGKGYVKLDPDVSQLLVVYHLSLMERIEASDIDRYYGLQYGSQMRGLQPTATSYDEGTLIIDLIQRESRKLVWRGIGRKQIVSLAKTEEARRNIRSAVAVIMKEYPPK